MLNDNQTCESAGQNRSISGYCTECFDLIRTRDQCWVYVFTSADRLLGELIGTPAHGYRPVCKICYKRLVKGASKSSVSARR